MYYKPLDIQTKNLTKAIFQQESGQDFNAVGDNGTSHGAGQWQDATWKEHAKQILGSSDAPMSKENQIVVAKGIINNWITPKDQGGLGLDAGQVAAKWNSGSEVGWENKVGTTTINGKPIARDVPAYVKAVTGYYQQYKNQSGQNNTQEQQPSQPQPASSMFNTAKDDATALYKTDVNLAKGAIKGTASSLQNIGDVIAKPLGKAMGIPEEQIGVPESKLQAHGIAQEVGKTAEQIAEFVLPETETTKIASMSEDAIKGLDLVKTYGAKIGGFLEKAISQAARSAIQGISAGAVGTAQTKDIKQGAEYGALGAIAEPVANAVKGLAKTGYKLTLGIDKAEARILQNYKSEVPLWQRVLGLSSRKAPTLERDTAFNKGLAGTESMIGVQAKRAMTNLWKNLIAPRLEKSTVKIDMPAFFKEAEDQIIKENPELARQNDLKNALESLKEDYAGVKTATLKDLQSFKEGWAKFVPERTYQGKPIAGNFNEVKDTLAGMARTKIYDALGKDVQQAYLDYGNLKGITEMGQKAMTGGRLKGGFGSFWSGIKDTALVPIGTLAGQCIYKLANGLELIAPIGLKKVSDVLFGQSKSSEPQP